MKPRKNLGIVAILFVCVLFCLNIFFIPSILASPPDNRGIETITNDSNFPEDTSGHSGESSQESVIDATIDINAITKAQAVFIAVKGVSPYAGFTSVHGNISAGPGSGGGTSRVVTTTIHGAQYKNSVDPFDDPIWFLLISEQNKGERYELIPDECTAEEYLMVLKDEGHDGWIGVNNDGVTVAVLPYDLTFYYILEINAITGEYTGWSTSHLSVLAFEDLDMDDILWQEITTWEALDGYTIALVPANQ